MHWLLMGSRGAAWRPENSLERYLGQAFPEADQVLLCCFELDLSGTRTYTQLRQALLRAGFPGPLARHVISACPLLSRRVNGCYHIRTFEE